jgi:hypothetical protein
MHADQNRFGEIERADDDGNLAVAHRIAKNIKARALAGTERHRSLVGNRQGLGDFIGEAGNGFHLDSDNAGIGCYRVTPGDIGDQHCRQPLR